jgi:hypothetical protein
MERTVMNISESRILEDCLRWVGALEAVFLNDGAKLPNNKANGKRFYSKDKKMIERVQRLHPDAKTAYEAEGDLITSFKEEVARLLPLIVEDFEMSVDGADDEAMLDITSAVRAIGIGVGVTEDGEGLEPDAENPEVDPLSSTFDRVMDEIFRADDILEGGEGLENERTNFLEIGEIGNEG